MKKLLCTITFIATFAVGYLIAQTPTKTVETGKDCLADHATLWDFYNSIRMFPAKILTTDRESKLIYYRFEERKQIVLGSVFAIPEGQYSKDFNNDYDSRFVFTVCSKHLIAWQIEKITK